MKIISWLNNVFSILPHKTLIGAAIMVAAPILKASIPTVPWDDILGGHIDLNTIGHVVFGAGIVNSRLREYLNG
jgi:hypothetical protein